MAIDKNTGEVITLMEAISFTHSFQNGNPDAIKAFFAGINKINLILEQENCIGIRIYNGYDDTQDKKMVFRPIDKLRERQAGKMQSEAAHIAFLKSQ